MNIIRHWMTLCETAFRLPPIRPASEDIYDVINATYPFGRNVGPRMVPIDWLKGGVAANDAEASRVAKLKAALTGKGGYISRPIVDTDGNIIEGQHRYEALRQLGATQVPVHVIEDLAANIDVPAFLAAINHSQRMSSDHRTQVARHVLDAVADEGSAAAARAAYEPPKGFEAAWNAAFDFLEASR